MEMLGRKQTDTEIGAIFATAEMVGNESDDVSLSIRIHIGVQLLTQTI